MKIDAHQHFWRYSEREYGWIGPAMEVLKQDFLPGALLPVLGEVGVGGTVAVQARQTVEETRWLLKLADRHPFIKGVVGWVDLRSAQLLTQLEEFGTHRKLCGVRHVVHDEPDDDFMMREDFRRGIEMLAEFGLTYDLLLFPRHLPVACELAERFPNQRFVLDHIAKPPIKEGKLDLWATDLRRLASFRNVFCKVSGMVTEAHWRAWKPTDFHPYLDVVFDAFGSGRIMFGSDWPVCTVAASYADVLGIVSEYIQELSQEDQAAVWGNNATSFYGLE